MESPKSYATATKTSPISHTAAPEEKSNMESLNREKASPLPRPSGVDPTPIRQDPLVKFLGSSVPSEMLNRALYSQTELIPTPGTKAKVQGAFSKILGEKSKETNYHNPGPDRSRQRYT